MFRRVLRGKVVVIIVVYVDDLLVASGTKRGEEQAINDLRSYFPIKDLGEAGFHLGCHITRDRDAATLKFDQHHYVRTMASRAGTAMRELRHAYKSQMRYYCTTSSSTGVLLQIQHTTMLVVEEIRVGRIDGGPGDGESTQLQCSAPRSCCQLATKRSSLHSVPQQPFAPNFRSPRVAMYGVASVAPVAPSRSRRRDFFLRGIFETGLAIKEPANLLQKTQQLVTQLLQHV